MPLDQRTTPAGAAADPVVIDHAEVVAMLATMTSRPAGVEAESIDSLELVWLLHQVETRTNRRLDLDDADLNRMATVDGAVEVLNRALRSAPVKDGGRA